MAALAAHAGVTLDGTLGPAGSIAGPAYVIPASVGRQAGSNLFHSFGTFSLISTESATFNGPAGIANIVSRVTGGTASSIDGLLRSTISGANFYLVNPSGVIFGPNASLDISGSFFVSTAHYVRLADGGRFDVATPANSVLTSAPPAAFGFLGPSGKISIDGSSLTVAPGKSIGLTGGDVSMTGGRLTAQSGQIVLASAASSGEVAIGAETLGTGGMSAMGNITLTNGALVSANESGSGGGGAIFIRGGALVMENASLVAHSTNGNGRGIELAARGEIAISGQGTDQTITTTTTGPGNAGKIAISAPSLALSNTAQIDSSADPGGSGSGGPVSITVADSFTIVGRTSINNPAETTGIASNSFGPGNAGAVAVSAARMSMSGYAAIQSNTYNAGNAGATTLNVGELELRNGAQITSATYGSGAGGSIRVDAAGSLKAAGASADNLSPSGIFTDAFSTGAGGTINISANGVSLLEGAEISSSSRAFATGSGGNVRVSAADSILVSGKSPAGDSSAIVANTFSSANAGSIELNTARLDVMSQGRVQSQSQDTGNGGDIVLLVNQLNLNGGGQITADTRQSDKGGTIKAGAAGQIAISGPGSGLFANAYQSGDSGNIAVSASQLVLQDGGGIFAFAQGAGRGGDLTIQSSSAAMTGGAQITAQSFGSGNAGSISLNAGDTLKIDASAITTEARQADGGNIMVRARDLITLNHAKITATVQGGLGNGGNITIDPTLLALNHSDIIANAFGGNGGNILIVADQFFRSPDSTVSASSQLGINGTVVIRSPITDLSGALATLSNDYLDTSALLANACAARLAGKASSLVLAGLGGLPAAPDRPLSGPVTVMSEAAPRISAGGNRLPAPEPSFRLAMLDCAK
jgi:filamentous hemagglutinin family protein